MFGPRFAVPTSPFFLILKSVWMTSLKNFFSSPSSILSYDALLLENRGRFLPGGRNLADMVLVELDDAGTVVKLDFAELDEVQGRIPALVDQQVNHDVTQGGL